MPIAEIEEIFNKYKKDESKIEHLLTSNSHNGISPRSESTNKTTTIPIENVIERNKQILKDLEIAKANLRSKAIFSPSEMQWERIYHNYHKCPSMPITTYKCHTPIFV